MCYDMEHYWPAEACSTSHSGPQLEPGQYCNPNVNNVYCSYLGTCSSDGTMCICNESPYRYSSERCAIYHSNPEPSAAPTVGTGITMMAVSTTGSCYTCKISNFINLFNYLPYQ